MSGYKKFALLIDGDSPGCDRVEEILSKFEPLGKLLIKNVYFNKFSLDKWEPLIRDYALHEVLVTNNTAKKNSVDIKLVVEAMELLYEREELDGFCIATSDSDFTHLAKHISSRGKEVYGIGTELTPVALRKACTEFFELVTRDSVETNVESSTAAPSVEISDKHLWILCMAAYMRVPIGSEEGWVALLDLKAVMQELKPGFEMYSKILADRLKRFAQEFPDRIEVGEQLDSKPVIHRVRFLKEMGERNLSQLRAAYNQLPKDKEGWVPLSALGQEVEYKGKLQKLLKQMSSDFSGIVQLDTSQAMARVRFR